MQISGSVTLKMGAEVAGAGITRPAGNEPRVTGRNGDGQRLITLALHDATVLEILEAISIGRLFGSATGRVGYGEGGLLDVDEKEQRRRITAGRAKTMSVTLANTSVREILNAICRAHGTLSWSLRPNVGRDGKRTYTIGLDSYDGWGVSKTVSP